MKKPAHLLVVEDEEDMLEGLEFALTDEGYRVSVARDGAEALGQLRRDSPDLVLLDLMLPERSGFDVLKTLRHEGHRMPVVILTARLQEADKVRGLDLGADDYVVKPFGLAELLARVRAHLRRSEAKEPAVPDVFPLGEATVDLRALQVRRRGDTHALTVKEGEMLRLLFRERGRPVSRDRFLEEVWGFDRYPTTRTVDQHIAKLRKKIEPTPGRPVFIRTVFGMGYRLET